MSIASANSSLPTPQTHDVGPSSNARQGARTQRSAAANLSAGDRQFLARFKQQCSALAAPMRASIARQLRVPDPATPGQLIQGDASRPLRPQISQHMEGFWPWLGTSTPAYKYSSRLDDLELLEIINNLEVPAHVVEGVTVASLTAAAREQIDHIRQAFADPPEGATINGVQITPAGREAMAHIRAYVEVYLKNMEGSISQLQDTTASKQKFLGKLGGTTVSVASLAAIFATPLLQVPKASFYVVLAIGQFVQKPFKLLGQWKSGTANFTSFTKAWSQNELYWMGPPTAFLPLTVSPAVRDWFNESPKHQALYLTFAAIFMLALYLSFRRTGQIADTWKTRNHGSAKRGDLAHDFPASGEGVPELPDYSEAGLTIRPPDRRGRLAVGPTDIELGAIPHDPEAEGTNRLQQIAARHGWPAPPPAHTKERVVWETQILGLIVSLINKERETLLSEVKKQYGPNFIRKKGITGTLDGQLQNLNQNHANIDAAVKRAFRLIDDAVDVVNINQAEAAQQMAELKAQKAPFHRMSTGLNLMASAFVFNIPIAVAEFSAYFVARWLETRKLLNDPNVSAQGMEEDVSTASGGTAIALLFEGLNFAFSLKNHPIYDFTKPDIQNVVVTTVIIGTLYNTLSPFINRGLGKATIKAGEGAGWLYRTTRLNKVGDPTARMVGNVADGAGVVLKLVWQCLKSCGRATSEARAALEDPAMQEMLMSVFTAARENAEARAPYGWSARPERPVPPLPVPPSDAAPPSTETQQQIPPERTVWRRPEGERPILTASAFGSPAPELDDAEERALAILVTVNEIEILAQGLEDGILTFDGTPRADLDSLLTEFNDGVRTGMIEPSAASDQVKNALQVALGLPVTSDRIREVEEAVPPTRGLRSFSPATATAPSPLSPTSQPSQEGSPRTQRPASEWRTAAEAWDANTIIAADVTSETYVQDTAALAGQHFDWAYPAAQPEERTVFITRIQELAEQAQNAQLLSRGLRQRG